MKTLSARWLANNINPEAADRFWGIFGKGTVALTGANLNIYIADDPTNAMLVVDRLIEKLPVRKFNDLLRYIKYDGSRQAACDITDEMFETLTTERFGEAVVQIAGYVR